MAETQATATNKVLVLSEQTSAETSFVEEDYPYGRKQRCQRRVWVETAVKGTGRGRMRFVYQTQNPRNGCWNQPHPGQYNDFIVMYKNLENNHIETEGIDSSSVEKVQKFKARWYSLLNEDQKKKLDKLEQMAIKINNYWSQRLNAS
jgi:hypothetical protein